MSFRPKQNMTINLRNRLKFVKDNLRRHEKGLEKAIWFCKLLKKNTSTSSNVKAWKQGIVKGKIDIKNMKRLIMYRQARNECYKIL